MAGISDKALKTNYAENKYRFNKGSELQNKEFSDGSGLELYETPLRSLDPQIGRWWQVDSKTDQSYESVSPYSAMNNDPIRFNDYNGDEGESCCGLTFTWENVKNKLNQDWQNVKEFALAAVNSAGSTENGYLNTVSLGTWPVNPAQTDFNVQTDINTTASTLGQLAGTAPIVGSGGVSPDLNLAPVGGSPSGPVGIDFSPTLPSVKVDASGNSGNDNQGSGQGRGSNNRKPDPQATGDHTVSDANGSTTYVKNDRNPSGFQEAKRVDVVGSDHGGVPTPHVHIPGQKLPTPATPQDIPKVDLSKNILPPPTH
jgi:RHS repeat-associated protein